MVNKTIRCPKCQGAYFLYSQKLKKSVCRRCGHAVSPNFLRIKLRGSAKHENTRKVIER